MVVDVIMTVDFTVQRLLMLRAALEDSPASPPPVRLCCYLHICLMEVIVMCYSVVIVAILLLIICYDQLVISSRRSWQVKVKGGVHAVTGSLELQVYSKKTTETKEGAMWQAKAAAPERERERTRRPVQLLSPSCRCRPMRYQQPGLHATHLQHLQVDGAKDTVPCYK